MQLLGVQSDKLYTWQEFFTQTPSVALQCIGDKYEVWMGWYPGLLVSGWRGVRYRAHYGAINHGDRTEL